MTLTPVASLKFFPGNARRGDIDTICESLEQFGQYKPIVVNKGTKATEYADTILAGNHTCMAAQRLGWDDIDVHWVDLDAATCRKVVLVDNKANDNSSYDVEALTELLKSVDDLDGTGFTDEEYNAILEALDGDNDEEEEPERNPQTVEGIGLLVNCSDIAEREALRAELLSRGFEVGDA
ncbi:ParB N-terminal domain-containing protein [Corynebacterium hindlerae]|uniref:ParB N-terminal domain-containing protein n=1 Tax=Corynebacterium hindlerae TaxID=699041 RepID=A0A7G5FBT6_9CORY|nr:ParB N-terminal domain-containing protein [Corynebacterium hindlerae]QMV84077.1 ParB N-terminal domain-containing protein [Corynebacterium hindlerae]